MYSTEAFTLILLTASAKNIVRKESIQYLFAVFLSQCKLLIQIKNKNDVCDMKMTVIIE